MIRQQWWMGLIYGFIYGFLLFIFAFFEAGGGHGSYAFFGVFSSPLALGGIPAAVLGVPFLWSAVGILLTRLHRPVVRNAFYCIIGLHYLGIPLILMFFEDGNLTELNKTLTKMPFLIFGIALYIAGQVRIWFCLAKSRTR